MLKKRQERESPVSELPLKIDATKVKKCIESQIKELLPKLNADESYSKQKYLQLRNLDVARVPFFNARRNGELLGTLPSDWKDAKSIKLIDAERFTNCSDAEKKLLLHNKKDTSRWQTKLVPLIIVNKLVEVLDLLADIEKCLKAGIHPYKFFSASSRGSLDYVQGGNCIQKVTLEAGVSISLTTTYSRHRAATIFANLVMPEKDRQYFFTHMGHSGDINENIYQRPPTLRKLRKVGSYLTN